MKDPISEYSRPDAEIFLTSTQAAMLLNVSVVTLRKYITLGKIKTIKTPGGHNRFRKKDLLEALYV